ncbi:hypothetical protein RHMOL_Rhmol02G0300400 [Rhododendron molle]|uniref:Uncharacterized protein n=1 Tax=Rhododendron molle TaxID=49168 RepID=A0ACC0PVG1_RHOML|nr:hypothetical protein RHMOL_Rhmol02G0300400 [Rhododendron molle]
MKLNCKWFTEKHNHLVVKLAISVLFLGLAFRLLFSQSTGFSNVSEAPFIEQKPNPQPVSVDFQENGNQILENGTQYQENGTQVPVNRNPNTSADLQENRDHSDNATQVSLEPKSSGSDDVQETRDQIPGKEKCDLFTGDWIPYASGPAYNNESCSWMESRQNCMKNGRPDTGYLFWRWNPRNCELPPFDAGQFLELMRNKIWGFIGDSITRNHVQSLLCILSKVEQVVEVYHDEEYKSKRWLFPSYNFTISLVWSPFLAKAAIFEDDNGISSAPVELYLDKLDPAWTNQYQDLDYMIFSSGEWFLKTANYYINDTIYGCHNCPNKNQTELGFNFAHRKVLQHLFSFIVSSNHKGTIFYRATAPDHFENGDWFNGGSCQRTEPAKEGEFGIPDLNKYLREVELEEFEKAAIKASEKGMKLKLLDVMQLSLLRPDGHPVEKFHTRIVSFGREQKSEELVDITDRD